MTKTAKTLVLAAVFLAGAAGFACAVDVSMHALGRKCGLPDTNQTVCYDGDGGTIVCPAPGGDLAQDGSYAKASSSPSYTSQTIGVDVVTIDNRTGLMWAANGNATGCNSGDTLISTMALAYCEGLAFANYSDWRLPNIRELASIVDYSRQNPSINTTYFPNTKNSFYWSSTTYVPNPGVAWYVYFSYGGVNNSTKTSNGYYVRCVRGGP